jgi:transcriptional regulator with XRE-family HTH domain
MNPDKEEIKRLLEILRTLMRMLAFSNREVERRLGLNNSSLTRLFNGQIEAKVEVLLGTARVIGLTYEEFFAFAYPNRHALQNPSEAARRIMSMLEDLRPHQMGAPAPAKSEPERPRVEPVDRGELLEEVKRAVREILDERGDAGEGGGGRAKSGK